MRLIRYVAVCALSLSSLNAYAWTIHADFDSGEIGTKAEGSDGFTGAAGRSLYSNETAISGNSAKLHIEESKTGWGTWGGELMFPEKAVLGDTLWYQVHVYFPDDFDHYAYGEGGRLKFLRIQTKSASNNNHGYLDVYIDKKGSNVPFKWIYEGDPSWHSVGTPSEQIVKGRWESYQMQVTLDNVPLNSGGLGEVRVWKNGVLLTHITDKKTLKESTDFSNRALLFTYWNGGAPQTQSMYADHITITNERPSDTDNEGNPRLRSLVSNPPATVETVSVD